MGQGSCIAASINGWLIPGLGIAFSPGFRIDVLTDFKTKSCQTGQLPGRAKHAHFPHTQVNNNLCAYAIGSKLTRTPVVTAGNHAGLGLLLNLSQ
jgi:hypothetical protein